MVDVADEPETMGSSVFLICESQAVAAEKYTALVASNSTKPQAQLAPAPNEIIWSNMAIQNNVKIIKQIIFFILLAGLFVAYMWGVTVLMGLINTK